MFTDRQMNRRTDIRNHDELDSDEQVTANQEALEGRDPYYKYQAERGVDSRCTDGHHLWTVRAVDPISIMSRRPWGP